MAKIGVSLSDYWLIIRKRKWISLFTFLIIFSSTLYHVERQQAIYKAVSSIKIIERRSVADMITSMVSSTTYNLMGSLPRVLTGRPVIERVVYELGLANENTTPQELEGLIVAVQGSARAHHEEGTNIINIAVEHPNPEMAAAIANTIAKVFIKVDADEKSEQARNVRIFIEEQLDKASKRLIESENKMKVFKESGQITGVALGIQNDIIALEKQRTELKKVFTDKYPDVKKIDEQIEDLKEQMGDLPENEIEFARLGRELGVSEGSYRSLQGKLEEARIVEADKVEDVKIVNPATIPGSPIRPKKELAQMLGFMVGIILGIFMAFVIENLDTSIGTIDDLEYLLNLPVLAVIPYLKPKTRHGGLWGLLNISLFGSGKSRRGRSEEIENMKQQLIIKFNQKSSATEAYRILRTNIKVDELLKTDKRILLISSTLPEEGKSITAVNLSLALAQSGYRTLLVDCDLRKAVIHKIFETNKEPGFTDIILGVSKPEAAIRNLIDLMMDTTDAKDTLKIPGLDNFSFLTCGKIVANPTELLDSARINDLFSSLKNQFHFIVLDTPPVLPVPDAIILGTKVADKLYLVYRAGHTSRIALLRAKDQLAMMKTVPTGIILNSTSRESQIVSNYYHHYYHYHYYSEKEGEK